MVGPNGFEPATSRLSGVRSNQLSYGPLKVLEYFTLARFIGQEKNNSNRENIWRYGAEAAYNSGYTSTCFARLEASAERFAKAVIACKTNIRAFRGALYEGAGKAAR